MNCSNRAVPLAGACKPAANDTGIGLLTIVCNDSWRDDPTVLMSLEGFPTSPAAIDAVDSFYHALGGSALRPQSRMRFREAIGAVIFDLLCAASYEPIRPCYRRLTNKAFTQKRVQIRALRAALTGFEANELIERFGGTYDRVTKFGTVTRIVPTPTLLVSLAGVGIYPKNRHDHFAIRLDPKRSDELIKLKAGTKRKDGRRMAGTLMPVDFGHPIVAERIAVLQRINSFMAKQDVRGADHAYFHCIFNQGDRPCHGYQKGARIWSAGGGFQAMPKVERRGITTNGEPTVELDIGSSHLTIFLASQGIPFDPQEDQYFIPGIPRLIVKLMVNLTLSQRWALSKWPSDIEEEYAEDNGGILAHDHPYDIIRERVLDRHPILKERASIYMDWGDFQYIESEAVLATVDRLASMGVVALPIHDSIIVSLWQMAVASYVLSMSFEEVVGVKPVIKPDYQRLLAYEQPRSLFFLYIISFN